MAKAPKAKKFHEALLLKLAAWILSQSEPVTRAQINEAFPDDYGGRPETAERKFTRDKDALKRLGFNLETEDLGGRKEQVGYAIDAHSSLLPPIDLTADEAEHLYRLDRIASVEPGTRVFGAHRGPPVARYARRSLYLESGDEREVTLRFRAAAARLARERYGKRARVNGDGSVSVTTKVTPGNYLPGIVLGYGGECTVEGPPDVVARMRSASRSCSGCTRSHEARAPAR